MGLGKDLIEYIRTDFMKRALRFFVPTVLLGTLIIVWYVKPNTTEEVSKENPGYFKQYFEMKKDPATGKIAMGLRSKWGNHDEMIASTTSDRRDNPIESVKELGPVNVGGRTRAVLIDRSNENRIFAGAVSGGLWYSANKGTTWTALNDAAATLSVTSITQNPFDHDVIYYGTGEARGDTYGDIGDGIFKSTDGGKTFKQIPSTLNSSFDQVWSIVHSETDANTIYAGTHNAGAWRSKDAGQTWEKITVGNTSVTDIEVFANGAVLLTYRGSGIYRSPNGNPGTFVKMTSAKALANGRIEIAKCDTKQEVVYAAMERYNEALYNMYKSVDTGKTWVELDTFPDIRGVQQIYCLALGVHPTKPDYVFVAGVNAKYTKNGGKTWGIAKGGHADHHAFTFFRNSPDEFLNGNDGGVYIYNWNNIGSTNATDINEGYNVVQFYGGNCAAEGISAIGGTQDNGTRRILAGATDRRRVYDSDGVMAHISFQDPDLAYSETQYGGIVRSRNYTSTQPNFYKIGSAITDSKPFVTNYEMNLADGNQLYFLTSRGIWRTINGGDASVKWENIATPTPSCFPIGLSNEENPTLFWGGAAGRLYRMKNAKDAEKNEQKDLRLANPDVIRTQIIGALTVHPDTNDVLYVGIANTGDKPKLFRASNAMGDTLKYKDISGDLPVGLPINFIQVDPEAPDRIIFVGTDFGLYYTDNWGNNWHKVSEIPNVPIAQLRMRESDRSLFVFTHGRGIWYLKLKANTKTVEKIETVKTSIYPNPATANEINIAVNEEIKAVKVYALDGKNVTSSVVLTKGNKHLEVSRLSTGLYIVSVELKSGQKVTQKVAIH